MTSAQKLTAATARRAEAQVRQRYGNCSGMWIERRQKDAGFPAPTFFGGLRFWRLSDLQGWDESQKAKPRPRASRAFKPVRS